MGVDAVVTLGEKEFLARQQVLEQGVSVNEKIYAEMEMIAKYTGTTAYLPKK